ncbi:hypothetical protein FOCC_FOCC003041 [Frankliniella occidentalis]|uniref:Transcription termination factor 4, mitochondrial n=1 Tax=Frankliniella occidentalis TaxID=133901 RepID=A0A9C6WW50_FRAOC|nr:transcription termination factor 4, mitochondrial [Frankliniella occidentalis]KAE8750233.1 hypothetical protein FOCC_FOCC003041 [Frankliniella occidentalis]
MNPFMKTGSLRTMIRMFRHNLCFPADTVNKVPILYSTTNVSPRSNFNDTANSLTLELIKNYGVKNERILQKVVNIPILSNSDPHEWKKVMEILLYRGLSPVKSVLTVIKHPALLKMSSLKINRVWDDWVECFQETELVKELLEECPMFLSVSGKIEIEPKYEQLKAIVKSKKAVAKILMNCPQIMFQSLTELQNVSDYLSEVMIARNAAEYSKSTVLGCTLQEVMIRHVFLDKCGKYKPPNLKQSESIPSGNASLSEIYDTSEEEFATKTAGVTLEEYVVFQSLFADELEDKRIISEEETDSDED